MALVAVLLAVGGITQLTVSGIGVTEAVFTDADTITDNSFATLDLVPPGNVTATFNCGLGGLGRHILVEWDEVGTAEGYEVARSTASGGPYTTLGTVDAPSTQYTDDTTESNTTYYYVVRTAASGWTSDNSAEASEETPGTICL